MVRRIFIYLLVISLVLAFVGVVMFSGNSNTGLSASAIIDTQKESYSREDVSNHYTERECWISSKGEVYDITLFLQASNNDALKEKCGENSVDLSFLNEDSKKIIEDYKIGILK